MLDSLKKIGPVIPVTLFFLLFRPPILPFNVMHVVGFISLLYLCFFNIQIDEHEKKIFILFFAWFVYLFFSAFLFNNSKWTCLVDPIYFVLDVVTFSIVCKNYMKKKLCTTDDVVNLFLVVCLFQVALVALALLFPSVHVFFYKKLFTTQVMTAMESFLAFRRNFGFAEGLTFSTPVMLSFFSVVFLAHYFLSKEKRLIYPIACLLCFGSALINARTSIVVFFIGCILFILFGKQKLIVKISSIFIVFLLYLLFDFLVLSYLEKNAPDTYEWIVYGSDNLKDFVSAGDAKEGYFSYVTDWNKRYRLPDFWGVFFGKGIRVLHGRNDFGFNSDIGYMNDLWLGGIVYMTIVYSIFYKCFYSLYLNKGSVVSFIGVFLMFVYPVLNFKGYIFSMNDLTNAMFFLYINVNNDNVYNNYKTNSI